MRPRSIFGHGMFPYISFQKGRAATFTVGDYRGLEPEPEGARHSTDRSRNRHELSAWHKEDGLRHRQFKTPCAMMCVQRVFGKCNH
jgi:hypothetical protein